MTPSDALSIPTRYVAAACHCNTSSLDKLLGQLGIDIRQSGHHREMLEYIRLLEQELEMTKGFLSEDNR